MTAGAAPQVIGLHWARPSFGGAVSGELLKLRRQRPALVMTLIGLLLLALVMLIYATNPTLQSQLHRSPLTGFYSIVRPLQLFFAFGAGVALLLTGSRLLGMEYELGTIRVIVGRGTGRWQLFLAKLAALCLFGLLLLVGFALLSAVGTLLVVEHQTGSVALLQRLPAAAWGNVGLALLACAVSELTCALLAITVTTLVRSVTAGMLLAVLFFPIDNVLGVALPRMEQITGSPLWRDATAFLLGPSLNRLPDQLRLQSGRLRLGLPTPAVHTVLPETLAVIGGWWLLMLLLSALSLRGHDILS